MTRPTKGVAMMPPIDDKNSMNPVTDVEPDVESRNQGRATFVMIFPIEARKLPDKII
jgi:hypothetical protein